MAGKCIIQRDALYWVPLVMITMGVRPEEILQLKLKDIRRRDGVLCMFFGEDEDDAVKAEQSRRILPIPQTLLNLGILDWVREKLKRKEVWAFPEVLPDANHERRSQIFGDRLRTLLGKLDLQCAREDVYAMRKTLSSRLLHLRVETGVRQRVLGHLDGTTVDRHYSDHGLGDLKAILDAVDYGIVVGRMPGIGFPVNTGCNSKVLPSLQVDVSLTDAGEVSALRVADPDTDETLFEAHAEGTKRSADPKWSDLSTFASNEIANRLLSLCQSHSLIMPASDVSAAAVEHLLVLGDTPASTASKAPICPVSPLQLHAPGDFTSTGADTGFSRYCDGEQGSTQSTLQHGLEAALDMLQDVWHPCRTDPTCHHTCSVLPKTRVHRDVPGNE